MGGGGGGGSVPQMSVQEQREWNQKNYNVSLQGLALQEKSMNLSEQANKMQAKSLEVSQEQTELSRESQRLQKMQITEPEKRIDSAKQASDATARAQELRRGIGSTFSRKSFGSGSAGKSVATSGTSAKLGG